MTRRAGFPLVNGFEVSVEPRYILAESDPAKSRFVFAYTITIANHGEEAAQLLNRYWLITNGDGKRQEVRGPGVVGNQPRIVPGRGVSLHERLHIGDRGGIHGRPLRVRERQRWGFRGPDRQVLAGRSRRRALRGEDRHSSRDDRPVARFHLCGGRHPGMFRESQGTARRSRLWRRRPALVCRRPGQPGPRLA